MNGDRTLHISPVRHRSVLLMRKCVLAQTAICQARTDAEMAIAVWVLLDWTWNDITLIYVPGSFDSIYVSFLCQITRK